MRSLPLAFALFLTTSSFAYTEFSPDARIGPAAFSQVGPVVASHGSAYLTAWTTLDPYPGSASVWISTPDATTATPLDPGNTLARGVSLSEGRDGWFAAWYSNGQVNVAPIDSFGRVELRTRVQLADAAINGVTYTAWNGAVHIVLCQSAKLTALLFDDNGNQIGSPMEIGNPDAQLAVIQDPAGFLVISSHPTGETDAIYGRRISSSGGVAGDWFLIRTVASHINGLAAAYEPSRSIIAWGDQFGVWSMDATSSAQLTPTAAAVTDVISANGRLWIAYTENGASKYLTIAPDLFVTAPAPLPVGGARLATNGGTMLAVGTRLNADSDVYGSTLTVSGAGDPFLISRTKTDQANGFISGKLLAWDEQIGAHRQVFVGGFDPAGRQLSSDGSDNTNPVAAFNGTDWLVVWQRSTGGRDVDIVARRVSADGEILDDHDIELGKGAQYLTAHVASDGVNWVVASIRDVAAPGGCFLNGGLRVMLNRVTPEGIILDGAGVMMPQSDARSPVEASIGWTGTRYIVAWISSCSAYHVPTTSSVSAAFVSSDLAEVDDFPVAPNPKSGIYSAVRVAAGEPSLIAFTDPATMSTQFRIVSAPLASRRRVYAASNPALGKTDGLLIDAVRNPGGTFSIFTQNEIVWAAGYRGVFETVVTPAGAQATSFRYTTGQGEEIGGNVDVTATTARIVETILNGVFDPASGGRRLWITEVAGAR